MGCFDPFVCPPTNKLCPNGDDVPADCKNKPLPGLPLAALNPGNAPAAPAPEFGAKTDARNGFAAPVACGRRPTPSDEPPPGTASPPDPVPVAGKPVGCAPRPKLLPNPPPGGIAPTGGDPADEAPSSLGVGGVDWGIGGSASRSDAPNDDVGLNALTPALKPVACGRSGAPVGWLDNAVLPVGCPPREPKTEAEKVEPVVDAVVTLVGDAAVGLEPIEVTGDVCTPSPGLPVTNEDATLAKVVVGNPVGCGLTCTWFCDCH